MSDETALVPKKNNGHGGRRPGAGHPMNRARAQRQLELMRSRGRQGLMVAIRKLIQHLVAPDAKVDELYLKTFKELADRCGLSRQFEIGDAKVSELTPDVVAEALLVAKDRIDQDPDRGEVVAVDADFEVLKPGDTAGTVQ